MEGKGRSGIKEMEGKGRNKQSSQAGVQENVVKFHGANDGAVGSHLSKILGA